MGMQIPPTSIRIPEDLKRWVGHRAVDNGVSLTKEVLNILYSAMRHEEERSKNERELA